MLKLVLVPRGRASRNACARPRRARRAIPTSGGACSRRNGSRDGRRPPAADRRGRAARTRTHQKRACRHESGGSSAPRSSSTRNRGGARPPNATRNACSRARGIDAERGLSGARSDTYAGNRRAMRRRGLCARHRRRRRRFDQRRDGFLRQPAGRARPSAARHRQQFRAHAGPAARSSPAPSTSSSTARSSMSISAASMATISPMPPRSGCSRRSRAPCRHGLKKDRRPHRLSRSLPPGCSTRLKPFGCTITFEDGRRKHFPEALEVRIANGAYKGGMLIAREADVESGDLVIHVVKGRSPTRLAKVWAQVVAGIAPSLDTISSSMRGTTLHDRDEARRTMSRSTARRWRRRRSRSASRGRRCASWRRATAAVVTLPPRTQPALTRAGKSGAQVHD